MGEKIIRMYNQNPKWEVFDRIKELVKEGYNGDSFVKYTEDDIYNFLKKIERVEKRINDEKIISEKQLQKEQSFNNAVSLLIIFGIIYALLQVLNIYI